MSENQEATSRVSTQEAEQNPNMEVREEFNEEPGESQPQQEEVEESEKLITPQRIINLQRDLMTLVTNIQTSADARESMRRTDEEEAHRTGMERLENEAKSSQEKFEEISRGWSIAKQVILQELHEALNSQQQICAAFREDKKKLIIEQQQELKAEDDRFVKDLRKQAEELDLMVERMEDQTKTLTKAYREEMAQIERADEQESEILLTREETEWEQLLKELWDEQLEWLTQRKKTVEEYEAIIHRLLLETTNKNIQTTEKEESQALKRETQLLMDTSISKKRQLIKHEHETEERKINLAHMKSRINSLQTVLTNLIAENSSQEKQFAGKIRCLSQDYKRNVEQYKRIQKQIKHFAVADARNFEEVFLTVEAEVKQLVEKVLVIDSICKQHLGLACERPPMEFMERSGPIQPQKQTWKPAGQAVSQLFDSGPASQGSQGMMDMSVGPGLETDTESTVVEMYKEGTALQGEGGAEVEEGELSMKTIKKVMELLCDEAGFLMDDKLLNLLAPLEKEEQTDVKLGSLLCSFGLEVKDVPKLAYFLLKYDHRQREQTEDVCVESGESSDKAEEVETKSATPLTSELIDPNQVVPALKSFLQQHMRESSARQRVRQRHSLHVDEAFWERMGNVISEDKVRLWDDAEEALQQFHAVLTEISELNSDIQSLKQQNAALRMLLLHVSR